jgi:hypothetical protein
MRAMDAHTRLPEVTTDQFALDRALKQIRKLRWIGQEIDAEKILAIMNEPTQPPHSPSNNPHRGACKSPPNKVRPTCDTRSQ